MRKAIQGTGDGLCGLYALMNFLILKDEVEGSEQRPRERMAMFLLCEVAQRLNLLTAAHMADGYNWADLKEIFNAFCERWDSRYVAVSMIALQELMKTTYTYRAAIDKVIEADGAVVVSVENGGHWVLAHASDHTILKFIDPYYKASKDGYRFKNDLLDGVAILPADCDLLRELNAKSH